MARQDVSTVEGEGAADRSAPSQQLHSRKSNAPRLQAHSRHEAVSCVESIRVQVREPGLNQGAQAVRAHRATCPGALSLWRRRHEERSPPVDLATAGFTGCKRGIRPQIWRRSSAARTPVDSPKRKGGHVASTPHFLLAPAPNIWCRCDATFLCERSESSVARWANLRA